LLPLLASIVGKRPALKLWAKTRVQPPPSKSMSHMTSRLSPDSRVTMLCKPLGVVGFSRRISRQDEAALAIQVKHDTARMASKTRIFKRVAFGQDLSCGLQGTCEVLNLRTRRWAQKIVVQTRTPENARQRTGECGRSSLPPTLQTLNNRASVRVGPSASSNGLPHVRGFDVPVQSLSLRIQRSVT
jgi:hypothetical protein